MKTIVLILLIVCYLMMALCIYFLFRNNSVRDFLLKINDAVHNNIINWYEESGNTYDGEEHDRRINMRDKIMNKYSYEQFLYSFKPLKLEYWFTDDEIDFIKEGGLI